jgi:hypothetical protein
MKTETQLSFNGVEEMVVRATGAFRVGGKPTQCTKKGSKQEAQRADRNTEDSKDTNIELGHGCTLAVMIPRMGGLEDVRLTKAKMAKNLGKINSNAARTHSE